MAAKTAPYTTTTPNIPNATPRSRKVIGLLSIMEHDNTARARDGRAFVSTIHLIAHCRTDLFERPRGRLVRASATAPRQKAGCWIAVGTVIADRPPHGPGRALVSASGSYRG